MTKQKSPRKAGRKTVQAYPNPPLTSKSRAVRSDEGVADASRDIPIAFADMIAQEPEFTRVFQAMNDLADPLFDAVDRLDLEAIDEMMLADPPHSVALVLMVFLARRRYKSDFARSNALAKADKSNDAKTLVLDEWRKSVAAGETNKAGFARAIAPRIRREFPKVEVTERTIATTWLSTVSRAHRARK
jgi:hypothetical protein